MKILAIRLARLGDILLLLPALSSLKASIPNAHLTLLTGHRCAAVAQLCPAIDAVMTVDRLAMRDGPVLRALADMKRLVMDIRRRRYDLVVDFHSFRETNLLTFLSAGSSRIGIKRHSASYLPFCFNRSPILEDKTLHVSQMFMRVIDAIVDHRAAPLDPVLRLSPEVTKTSRLALYVDAPVPERVWPPEQFAVVADFAVEALGASVVVMCGRGGENLARRVLKASRQARQLELFTDIPLRELARLIASSRLLVSNDTGPMHLGPALGVPTLGLFSVGYPEHFRPIGRDDKFLRANPIENIRADRVVEAVNEIWSTTADPNLRR